MINCLFDKFYVYISRLLFKVVFLDVKIAKNVQNRQNCKKCSKSNHPNVQKTIMKGRRPNPSVMYNLPYP